jgi:predicted nucleotidyltransferase
MTVLDSFDTFQGIVNAPYDMVAEARRRRRIFEAAFQSEGDVTETIPSGSLARGTHKDPIHDVDLVVVFDDSARSGWGSPGESAAESLDYVRSRVNDLLGATNGSYDQLVRLARWRNHAVKCFLDDPEDPDAFTVDVMPALRRDSHLLVPEAVSRTWIPADPEFLISEARAKHDQWRHYAGMVRMLKWWGALQPTKIKSLVMEVLALEYLPTDTNRPAAVRDFFTRASYSIGGGEKVVDPARLCGEIQPDLDYTKFAELLEKASESAALAITAQADNNQARASQLWADVFGDRFPLIAATTGVGVTTDHPRPVKDTPQG